MLNGVIYVFFPLFLLFFSNVYLSHTNNNNNIADRKKLYIKKKPAKKVDPFEEKRKEMEKFIKEQKIRELKAAEELAAHVEKTIDDLMEVRAYF